MIQAILFKPLWSYEGYVEAHMVQKFKLVAPVILQYIFLCILLQKVTEVWLPVIVLRVIPGG